MLERARLKGLVVQSVAGVADSRNFQDEVDHASFCIMWCNCAACSIVAKPPITERNPRGRYFTSLTTSVEHAGRDCRFLRMHNNDAVMRIADPVNCAFLHAKLADGSHRFCETCMQDELEYQECMLIDMDDVDRSGDGGDAA